MDGDALECKRSLEPEEILPGNAVFVAHYDMDRERRLSPRTGRGDPTQGVRMLMPEEIEIARLGWIAIAASCDLDTRFFGEAWVSFDAEEELLVVIEGKGVGDETNLRCISERLEDFAPDIIRAETLKRSGCGITLGTEDDDYLAFAPHDNLLVLGSQPAVLGARTVWNGGFPNPPTELLPKKRSRAWLHAAFDVEAYLTEEEVGALIDQSGQSQLALGTSIKTVEAQALLGRKLTLQVSATFGTEGDVRAAHSVLHSVLRSPPPSFPPWSQQLLREIELAADGPRVSLSLPIKKKQAHQLGLLPSRDESRDMPAFAWLAAAVFL